MPLILKSISKIDAVNSSNCAVNHNTDDDMMPIGGKNIAMNAIVIDAIHDKNANIRFSFVIICASV